MRSLLAALAFCTRIPISTAFSAEDVGRSARWFPAVGLLLGGAYWGLALLTAPRFPALLTAAAIVTAEALITGGLHFDGLADTLDGFGGGKTRDDVLRIMRDHAIGVYGGLALILLAALKIASFTALIEQHRLYPVVLLASVLGRWNVVLLSSWLPYARPSQAVSRSIGRRELVWATALTALIMAAIRSWQGAVCWGACAAVTILFGWFCKKKIGGVTGDTIGASEQIGEVVVLLLGVALP